MSIYGMMKAKGRAASDYYAGSKEYFTLSPAGLALVEALQPLVSEHCKGKVLDAGAGRGAYRDLLKDHADCYVGMDVAASNATAAVGDTQRLPFADATFDTVFCSQVLEHVPEPWLALAEFRRVLKPGGKLLLSVPHISWLHNEPHDYYRYTCFGLDYLLKRAGFDDAEITPAGGLLCLLGHIPAALVINMTFGVPYLHSCVRFLNAGWVRVCSFLDRFVDRKKIFALNYVCSASKS